MPISEELQEKLERSFQKMNEEIKAAYKRRWLWPSMEIKADYEVVNAERGESLQS